MRTYALLVQRLAAALRVSDAIRIINYVSRAGVSSTEEVIICANNKCIILKKSMVPALPLLAIAV